MGIYSASKHAMEAIAETMKLELQEFGVAIVNPGPFLTGFNDRMFQTYQSWGTIPPHDCSTTRSSPSRAHSSTRSRYTPP